MSTKNNSINELETLSKGGIEEIPFGKVETRIFLSKERTVYDNDYKNIGVKRFEIPLLELTIFPNRDTQSLQIENMKRELKNDLSIFNKSIKQIGKQAFFVITSELLLDRIERLSKNLDITDEEFFLAKIVEFSLEEKFEDSVNYSLKFLISENKINQTKLIEFFPTFLEKNE